MKKFWIITSLTIAILSATLPNSGSFADIITNGDTFGGSFWATSNDANQNALAQTGEVTFGSSGQQLTSTNEPNIVVTTSQIQNGDESWTIVLNFETVDSTSFIPPSSSINNDEINLWTLYYGETERSTNALNLNSSVVFNSAVAEWIADNTVLLTTDQISDYGGVSNSISGEPRISIPPGGNPGSFDVGSDLGTFGIDQVRVTLNVAAIPEPSSLLGLTGYGLSLLLYRRRR